MNKEFKDKIEFLEKAELTMKRHVKEYAKVLYESIKETFLPLFDVKDGHLVYNDNNVRLLQKVDNIFDELQEHLHKRVLLPLVDSMNTGVELSIKYYLAIGYEKKAIRSVKNNLDKIEKLLGITSQGRLRKSGYLYKLGQTSEVRHKLKDYVIKSLTSEVSLNQYRLGFRNLVLGNRRKEGLATNGVLDRYFSQYAYDSFNNVDAIVNKQIASNLGLKYFVYEGSVIKTTRAFCRKRAGKAFTITETKKWKNDPDLIDKKTKDSYRPLIERGRYNCRHWIRYVSKDIYIKLK